MREAAACAMSPGVVDREVTGVCVGGGGLKGDRCVCWGGVEGWGMDRGGQWGDKFPFCG